MCRLLKKAVHVCMCLGKKTYYKGEHIVGA